jgi:multiple sugar transport system substrate-binding protein
VKNDLLGRKFSTRARVTAAPAAAIAFAAPTIIKRSASAQGATTVRLTGWSSSPQEDKLLGQVIDGYNSSQSAVKIDYQLVPTGYPEKLQTDIAAGTVADVFYVDSLLGPDLMSRGALLPIDDKMAASGVKPEDFYPGLLKAFQFQGTTYGLPKDWSSLAMVYNQDALTAAGVTTPPTDWDSLKGAAQALKDKSGEARLMMPSDPARYFAFQYAAGGTVISADGTEVQIDTPESKTALDFYYGLYKDGLSATPADAGAQWPGDGLAKGLSDLVFEGNWVFPFLQANAPNLKFGISPMPKGPAGNATLGFTVSYSIYAQTKIADAAWDVVNYLTGPDGMAQWTSLGLAMPSRTALADPWLAKFPERKPFLDEGSYAHGWAFGPGGQQFYNDVTAVMENLFAGKEDTTQALKDMQAAGEKDLHPTGGATPAAGTPASG